MPGPDGFQRIPPIAPEERTAAVTALLEETGATTDNPFLLTIARHPGLMRRWLPFTGKLMADGKLPPRLRELAVLRTAWRCQAAYAWGQHVRIGHAVGLTPGEVEAVCTGPEAPAWDGIERAVLRAADELHDAAVIGDATWADLAAQLDHAQLLELLFLLGQYRLLAGMQSSLRIAADPATGGLEAR